LRKGYVQDSPGVISSNVGLSPAGIERTVAAVVRSKRELDRKRRAGIGSRHVIVRKLSETDNQPNVVFGQGKAAKAQCHTGIQPAFAPDTR